MPTVLTTIIEKRFSELPKFNENDHILTYAEEGFSPLSIHGKAYKIPVSDIKLLVKTINLKNETGSLYPKAPISAIPRHLIRSPGLAGSLTKVMSDFLRLNEESIMAKRLFVEFGSPKIPEILIEETQRAIDISKISTLEEIYIVKR